MRLTFMDLISFGWIGLRHNESARPRKSGESVGGEVHGEDSA